MMNTLNVRWGHILFKKPSRAVNILFTNKDTVYKHIIENRFDLVIIDKEMIGNDLKKMIREIRSVYPETVIFVTTSKGNVESFFQIINSGVYEYLIKPFDSIMFEMAVANALL